VFAALAVEPAMLGGPSAWVAVTGAASLLALDGVDGWAARRQRLASAFGARFDMEVDALMILALAAIAAGLGKAGGWVLALGLIRYGFVLAGWLVPRLARPLPPSRRRRAVCALQVATLGLLLAPPLQPPWSGRLAVVAFAALLWSFAVDVRWLLRRAP
jgi:phosphatidylglycerophosphate synthase